MKTISTILSLCAHSWRGIMVMAAAMTLSLSAMAQTGDTNTPNQGKDAPRERPMRHGGPEGGRSRAFKPQLEGTWQLCTLSQGENGQPQISFMPVLRVYSAEGTYQTIAIPSEGGCYIADQATIAKTSDTTYVATPIKMPSDTLEAQPTEVEYQLMGPIWLSLKYQKAGEEKKEVELWFRVRHRNAQEDVSASDDQRRGRNNVNRPRQGQRNRMRSQLQRNPFDRSSESSRSISEADD